MQNDKRQRRSISPRHASPDPASGLFLIAPVRTMDPTPSITPSSSSNPYTNPYNFVLPNRLRPRMQQQPVQRHTPTPTPAARPSAPPPTPTLIPAPVEVSKLPKTSVKTRRLRKSQKAVETKSRKAVKIVVAVVVVATSDAITASHTPTVTILGQANQPTWVPSPSSPSGWHHTSGFTPLNPPPPPSIETPSHGQNQLPKPEFDFDVAGRLKNSSGFNPVNRSVPADERTVFPPPTWSREEGEWKHSSGFAPINPPGWGEDEDDVEILGTDN